MSFEYTSEKERAAVHTMRRVFESDPHLRNQFIHSGVSILQLEDPDYADYLGDWLVQELGGRVTDCNAVRQALRKQLRIRSGCTGSILGTVTDRWERYPLESMLRLIWRHRREPWQMRFLKGEWYAEDLPDMWQLEIRPEGNRHILHCHSYADGSYLQTVISGDPFAADYSDFCQSIREFLDIRCGTVWLSGLTTIRMEVAQ